MTGRLALRRQASRVGLGLIPAFAKVHETRLMQKERTMWYATRLFTLIGFLGGLLLSGVANLCEAQGLQVGDPVPPFKCRDDRGRIWDSREHIGKKVVVVYFYPGDFARCCTRQAQCYRDKQRELTDFDVEVVGISADTVEAHLLFKYMHALKHTLLSDLDGDVARMFGVPLREGGKAMPTDLDGQPLIGANGAAVAIPRNFTAERWTFVIDKSGRVIHREAIVAPKKDTQEVLDFLCESTYE